MVAKCPRQGVDVRVLLDAARQGHEATVDVLTGPVLDDRMTDGLVEGLCEVLRVKELQQHALRVHSHHALDTSVSVGQQSRRGLSLVGKSCVTVKRRSGKMFWSEYRSLDSPKEIPTRKKCYN
jgi:hypothetical protein